MSVFDHLPEIGPQQIWDSVAVRAVHGDRISMGVIELDPGAIVPEHSHANEQLGIVLSGTLTFRVGSETRELGPGGTWRILSNDPHEARAGPDGAVVLDVFAPPRDDWGAFEPEAPRPPRWP